MTMNERFALHDNFDLEILNQECPHREKLNKATATSVNTDKASQKCSFLTSDALPGLYCFPLFYHKNNPQFKARLPIEQNGPKFNLIYCTVCTTKSKYESFHVVKGPPVLESLLFQFVF